MVNTIIWWYVGICTINIKHLRQNNMEKEGFLDMSQNTYAESQQDTTELAISIKVKELYFAGHPGLGFGEGAIDRNQSEGSEVESPDTLEIGDNFIVNGPNNFLIVDEDPSGIVVRACGCIDGRIAEELIEPRYKVAGGSLMHTTAALIGCGHIEPDYRNQISLAANFMKENNIEFGGHIDDNADQSRTGCGAVDNFPNIISNSQKYRSQIELSIQDIIEAIDSPDVKYNQSIMDEVMDNYLRAFQAIGFSEYNGNFAKNVSEQSGAVIPSLNKSSSHKERAIVINLVGGITFNQRKVDEITAGYYQAFSYDMPAVMKIAERIGQGSDDVASKAFYGELVYTLASSATLTNGSQKVFLVSEA